MKKYQPHFFDGPLLDTIRVSSIQPRDGAEYPFNLDIIKHLSDIVFPTNVTFFIGENGTGKSTLLEAIAAHVGFGPEGGSKNIHFTTSQKSASGGAQALAEKFTLSWRQKPRHGYFFRAESFFNVASFVDELVKNGGPERAYSPYGGKSLHEQSHGESFLAFFNNALSHDGFFIFDEPESALSPQRQLALLAIINDMCKGGKAQFIIATHSPLWLAYPGDVMEMYYKRSLIKKLITIRLPNVF